MKALLSVYYFAECLAGFLTSLAVVGEHTANVVPYPLECLPDFLITALDLCRIGERPVMPIRLTGETGAGLVRIVADSDNGLNVAVAKLV